MSLKKLRVNKRYVFGCIFTGGLFGCFAYALILNAIRWFLAGERILAGMAVYLALFCLGFVVVFGFIMFVDD